MDCFYYQGRQGVGYCQLLETVCQAELEKYCPEVITDEEYAISQIDSKEVITRTT